MVVILIDCPGCGVTIDVLIAQHNGATDLLPDVCDGCGADLGPAYEDGQWAYA